MQKNTTFFCRSPQDRGVALLFSLGILSALMLLGIAFMGSSLFSRRIAENRSTGTEAMILARSTANLVAAAVESYCNILSSNSSAIPQDFRAVFSVGDTATKHNTQDEYGEFLRGYKFHDLTNEYISSGGSDTRYFSKLDVSDHVSYHGNDSNAQWVYVRVDDDDSTSGRIIGRYAYQVLPAPGHGRLNLGHTLRGGYERVLKYPGMQVKDDATPETYSSTSRNAKWGQSTAELDFEGCTLLKSLQTMLTDSEKIPANFEDLYASETIFEKGTSANFAKIGRAWMTATFTEGNNPQFREVAPNNHQRFDLAAVEPKAPNNDAWLSHFDSATANSEDLLENHLTKQVAWSSSTFYFNSDLTDRPGLPFLRYIGNDKASFGSLSALRHQIAANFNDYCDADSIPTSNVLNASWSPSNAPNYTGNERTLYINELLIGCFMKFSISGGIVKLDSANNFPADIVLGAELIDIYGKVDASGNLSAENYFLQGKTTGSAKLAILPKIKIASYTYEVSGEGTDPATSKSGSNFDWEPSESDLSGCGKATAEQSIEWKETNDSKISFKRLGTDSRTQGAEDGDPYKFNAAKVAEVGQYTWEFLDSNTQLKEKAKAALQKDIEDKNPGKTITITGMGALTLDGIKRSIKDWKIQLAPSGLVLNDGSNNVDYVKVPQISVGEIALDSNYKGLNDATSAIHFLIGGMEAKDPRQNLNVNPDASGIATDWTWDPKVTSDVNNSTLSLPTGASLNGSIVANNDLEDFIDQLRNALTGSVNNEAHPNNAGSNTDLETVTDPGWKSNTEMISTAVIRNAPMKSPWELGFIHRGAQFQTINLKKADDSPDNIPDGWGENSNDGTAYNKGDGGILDWIRMTEANYSDGKINLNQFGEEKTTGGLGPNASNSSADPDNRNRIRYRVMGNNDPFKTDASASSNSGTVSWEALDKELLTALFYNLPIDTAADFVNTETPATTTKITTDAATFAKNLYDALKSDLPFGSAMEVRSEVLNLSNFDWSTLSANQINDATQEEIIGRTINLLTAKAEPPAVFRAVIVAQSIQDIGGINEKIQVISSDHPDTLGKAKIGDFDGAFASDNLKKDENDPITNIHYDIITGEAKILVTYEWNPASGKVVIRDIENIE